MNKKILRSVSVLGLVTILSCVSVSTSVQASENACTDNTNNQSETTLYASDEVPAEMKDFYEHMLSGEELQEGEERIFGNENEEEFGVKVTAVSESATANSADAVNVYKNDEISSEMEEFCSKMMSDEGLKAGEERVLGTFDGEKFCVKVSNVTESAANTRASAATTSTKEFTFYKKNILGIKKNVLKVTSKCTWVKGSKINNLQCTYNKLVSDISCSWNDNYTKATDTLHTLGLDITLGDKTGIIFFGASLSMDKQTLTLDSSADYL